MIDCYRNSIIDIPNAQLIQAKLQLLIMRPKTNEALYQQSASSLNSQIPQPEKYDVQKAKEAKHGFLLFTASLFTQEGCLLDLPPVKAMTR